TEKSPGIPSLWPFKNQLLNEIDQQKRKIEDEKQRQKKARNALFNKNRNLNFSSLAEDASKRDVAFESDPNNAKEVEDETSTAIDAVAIGHKDNSHKTYYKEFQKVIEAADVILEILDARDPLGYRTKQIEKMIDDLVPRENVMQWLEDLRKEYPTVAFRSSTQTQRNSLGHASTSTISDNNLQHCSECLGADALINLLKNYSRSYNIKTSIAVGVIGYPNVGKSSVINSLKRSKVCGVGATPGLTKHAQEIHLDKNIKLLDSPGIVFARNQGDDKYSEILLKNCVKIELSDNTISPVVLIVFRYSPQQLMNKYNVPMFKDANDFLIHVARQRGKLKRGGIPDIEATARIVLQDWNSGKISYYTMPPTSTEDPIAVDSKIVQWSE
ncbi:7096_t:CDS:2, partial [Cetraspora pellucida]